MSATADIIRRLPTTAAGARRPLRIARLPIVIAAALAVGAASLGAPASGQTALEATSPNGETTLVVEFEVKPGFEAEFEAAFALSARCSRLEPGNIAFNVHAVRDAPGRFILYEIWRSPEALAAHFERPYTRALFAMFDRALVAPITDGGLRFLREIAPAARAALAAGDPADVADCA